MFKTGKSTLEIMDTASWYNKWLFNLIKPHLGDEILEVGAGMGSFTKLLSGFGNLTTIDIEKQYLKILSRKFTSGICIGYGDIERGKYFFKNKRFDSIVCMNVLEHIHDDRKALGNMHRLLKNSGKLILLVPAYQFLFSRFDRNLDHFRRYNKRNLEDLVGKVGLEVVSMRNVNCIGTIGWFLFIKLVERSKMPRNEVSIFDKLGKYFLWIEKLIEPPFGLSILVVARKK